MNRKQQQQQQQQQQLKRLLVDDATSYGPFLWSPNDTENALLWFTNYSKSDTIIDDLVANTNNGFDFLRIVINAYGFFKPSPVLLDRKQYRRSKSRKRKSTGGEIRRQHNKKSAFSCSPLQSVLMGYYQLFFTPVFSLLNNIKYCQNNNMNESGGSGDKNMLTVSLRNAERASETLLYHLNAIISARQCINNISNSSTFMNVSNRKNDEVRISSNRALSTFHGTIRMGQIIDKYMAQPITCTKRVYASKLFDRLVNLCGGSNQVEVVNSHNMAEESNDARQYLEKLFGLASTNHLIREIIITMLLEPVRRLQTQGEPKRLPFELDAQDNKPTYSETNFLPLLISTSFWEDNRDSIEQVCLQYPLPSMVQFIIATCPKSTSLVFDGTELTTKEAARQTILWWKLPSPLLCSISQIYFIIACKYIQYIIEIAYIGHGQLYKPRNETFHHAIQRIKQFCSTSDRLKSLCCHALCIIERNEQVKKSLSSEVDGNSSFRKDLARRAIHKSIE